MISRSGPMQIPPNTLTSGRPQGNLLSIGYSGSNVCCSHCVREGMHTAVV